MDQVGIDRFMLINYKVNPAHKLLAIVILFEICSEKIEIIRELKKLSQSQGVRAKDSNQKLGCVS